MVSNDFGIYASGGYSSRGSRFSRAVYLFSWSLVGVAGVAGLLFSLYRNDVLFQEARRRGMERPYLALERRLLGTPGWGTPRSLLAPEALADSTAAALGAPVAFGGTASPAATPAAAPSPPPSVASEPTASRTAEPKATPEPKATTESKPTPEPKPAAPTSGGVTSEGVKITSLDALAPLPRGASHAAAPVTHTAAPVARAAAPTRPAHVAESKPSPARFAAASEPKAKPAPPPAKAAVPKPAPAPKAAPPPRDDNPLNAAIRGVIAKDAAGK
ncbi:MAG TPA: hypothetical protein VFQ35_08095 [Polyangiaceae bacterium]|nr:hypothetical protein [Polyangiaceae bacterium]